MQQTLTLDAVLSMGRNGDPTQFIGVATAALAQGVSNDDLRLLLVRRLAESGLLSRAGTVAEGFSSQLRAQPEVADMLTAFGSMTQAGRASWANHAHCFKANLRVLRDRYAWAGRVAEVWAAEEKHLELHATREGAWQIFDRREGPQGGWRPSFGNHQPQPPVADLAAQFKGSVLAPFVIDGVGHGYHLPWLHQATADTFLGSSALIYQIEPSLPALAAALHLSDWRLPLADERVRLCCGPDAYAQFASIVASETWNSPPSGIVRNAPWDVAAASSFQSQLDGLTRRSQADQAELRKPLDERYSGRDQAWWHRRFSAALAGDEPPLRVLGFTCRFTTVLQYSMRDALKGLREIGCRTHLLIEPNDYARITPRRKLEAIREFEPDLILLIDHTRAGQHEGMINNVPVVTWIQDRLPWLFDRAVGATFGPLDYCLGFCRDELVKRHGYPAERFMACDMATDPAALQADANATARDNDDEKLVCDAAFATNRGQLPDEIHRQFRDASEAPFHPLLDAIHEEIAARAADGRLNGGLRLEPFVCAMERSIGVELKPEARADVAQKFVRPLVDGRIRRQTIAWAVSWAEQTGRRFHLYGKGWDADAEFSAYARGFIEHGPVLGRAFRAATINLHAGCNQAFHQRVLDGLSAGGFFLIRRHASDVWIRFKPAIVELVRGRNLNAGDQIDERDIPADLRDGWREFRRMLGDEPDAPYVVSEALIESFDTEKDPKSPAVPALVWPDLNAVTFANREELCERLDQFLANDEERLATARDMRARMVDVFNYQALMRRLLEWMRDGFSEA